jgi:hypothetical protein
MCLGSSVAASSSGNKKKKEARYLLLFLTLILAFDRKLLEGFYRLYSYHIDTERKQVDSQLCVQSSIAPLSFSASEQNSSSGLLLFIRKTLSPYKLCCITWERRTMKTSSKLYFWAKMILFYITLTLLTLQFKKLKKTEK